MLWTTPVHTQLGTCRCGGADVSDCCRDLISFNRRAIVTYLWPTNIAMRVCFLLSQQQLRCMHEFELTAILWDITQCSPIEVFRCFRRIHCLHIRGFRVSQTSSQEKAGGLPFNYEVNTLYMHPKRLRNSTRVHSVTLKKTVLFAVTAVSTPSATMLF
jgi:hypothetical protein